jgi:hypothetical protein
LTPNVAYELGAAKTATVNITNAPGVTITASDASAVEGSDSFRFTITRSGSTAKSLVVHLSTSGTASNGDDYNAIPASVTIPAGAPSVNITRTPFADPDGEGHQSVIVTIQPHSSYGVAAPGSASADISDGASVVKLSAIADAHVRGGAFSDTNFGSATQLVSKHGTGDAHRLIFLKFDLSGVSTITSATLRLFGRLSNTSSVNVPTGVYSCSDTTWSESGLTYDTRPASGTTALATATITDDVGRWYEWDLTAYLQAEKAAGHDLVTLVLKNPVASLNATLFNSDEATDNRPELVIT